MASPLSPIVANLYMEAFELGTGLGHIHTETQSLG